MQEQKKSPPKTLTSLESTTEAMIEDIQKLEDARSGTAQQKQEEQKDEQDKKEQGKNPEGQDKEKDKKTEDGQQKDKAELQNKDQGSKENQTKTVKIDWNKMGKNVEKLQTMWSNYLNIALKDGASKDLVKDYGNQLDVLTTKVMEQQEGKLLDSVNELYKYYPKFFDLYKHQAPPNVKEVKYYIRKIIIGSERGEWFHTAESIEAIKQAWETAKSRMEKPDRDMNDKIESAIDSFSRSVEQRNKYLVKMKGNILIKNLEEIK